MNVSIFGLGYVGTVTAACMAQDGHKVIGVDVSPDKVEALEKGRSTISEPSLEVLLREGVQRQLIEATTDVTSAVRKSDVSLISVGTPPSEQGGPELIYVQTVCQEIGRAVREKAQPHVVILRSTVPPGTLHACRALLQEEAGETTIHVAFNPEFLREGSAVRDYAEPPYTVVGTDDPVAERAIRQLYAGVDAPVIVVKPEVAEMLKYVANTWHATKIAFANEVGRVARAFDIDGREVMELITRDTKLNVSPAYLRPGFAYGGSCLPKDLASMIFCAERKRVSTPLLSAIPRSNELMIQAAVERVLASGAKRIGVLGLAFKPDTDDVRESPAVPLIKQLIGEGRHIKIYDPAVYRGNLLGANLNFIQRNLPHFADLIVEKLEQALEGTDLIVVMHSAKEIASALSRAPQGTAVLDLAGLFGSGGVPEALQYEALCW